MISTEMESLIFMLFEKDKHESYYIFRTWGSVDENFKNVFRFKNPYILGRVLYQLVQQRGFKGRRMRLEGKKQCCREVKKQGNTRAK